jgi:hypothetical protein
VAKRPPYKPGILGDPSKPLIPASKPSSGGSVLGKLGATLAQKGNAPDPLANSPIPLLFPKPKKSLDPGFAGTAADKRMGAPVTKAVRKPVVAKKVDVVRPRPVAKTPVVRPTRVRTAPNPVAPGVAATSEKPTSARGRQATSASPGQNPYAVYDGLSPRQAVQQLQAGQYAALDNQDSRRTAALNSFTQAVLAQLQGGPAQVGGFYDNAAAATNGFAQTAAAGLANANPNQGDQQLLAAINAPAAQRAQLQNQLANTFGGGAAVLYKQDGAIPGTALEAGKAAAQTYARSLPSITALAGQQGLTSMLSQSNAARDQLRAQAPALNLQIEQARSDAAIKQAGLAQNAAALGLRQKQFNLEVGKANVDIAKFNARQYLATMKENRQYQIAKASLGLRTHAAEIAYVKAVNKQTDAKRWLGYGASTYAQLYKRGGAAAEAMKNGIKDKNGNEVAPPLNFWDAVAHMQENGIPEPMAITILSHTYQPGQQGRPGTGLFPLLRSKGYSYAATALGVWTPKRRK